MPTLITITLDLDRIRSLNIDGPIKLTLPKAGYLRASTRELPGASLERLRVWTERRKAQVNPAQYKMDDLGGESNA